MTRGVPVARWILHCCVLALSAVVCGKHIYFISVLPIDMESPSRKKTKWNNQTFSSVWLTDHEFSEWLERDIQNKGASFCKCCKFTLRNANR